ncbi:SMI1/KNR4 family protein [Amycolatopsis sp. NPDC006131]|uniref:SMI1/KNR4 family protein n=1 Tax=Amycolatopsis sp. NPDC006131 TaxID=3156731 RepID=UPI0033B484DF
MEEIQQWGPATFRPPATEAELQACEATLGHAIPDELRRLLAETNGIVDEMESPLLWNTQRISAENVYFRTSPDVQGLYMPFEGLVFFSDAGNGDQFGVSLSVGNEVYAWDHEDDSRMWVAQTVLDFLQGWMTGTITT